MALLKEDDRAALRAEFEQLTSRVRLVFFSQALGCETCPITLQILEEVAPLSDQIELVKYNFAIDRDEVARYGIARIPAIAVVGLENQSDETGAPTVRELDYGIRFYGVPSGYEFMSLIGAILDVSSGDSSLAPETRELVARVIEPTHIQVFTTPT